jgi:uncharacterized protein (TIGR02118 family)
MIKYVGISRLKSGYDRDETWELWRTKHTTWVKDIMRPELKRYIINRVVKTVSDNDIFGFAEMLFDDVESFERAFNRILCKGPDEFMQRLQNVDRILLEYEEVKL